MVLGYDFHEPLKHYVKKSNKKESGNNTLKVYSKKTRGVTEEASVPSDFWLFGCCE